MGAVDQRIAELQYQQQERARREEQRRETMWAHAHSILHRVNAVMADAEKGWNFRASILGDAQTVAIDRIETETRILNVPVATDGRLTDLDGAERAVVDAIARSLFNHSVGLPPALKYLLYAAGAALAAVMIIPTLIEVAVGIGSAALVLFGAFFFAKILTGD